VCDERILHLETVQAETFIISLTAKVVYDEQGHPDFVDGVIQEVTAARKREAEREALIEKMQTSLLFLHEPVGHLGRQVITCQLEQSVQSVAAQMSHQSVSAALVVSESGAAIGIVTDHDLRARVVAQGKDVQRVAVRSVMSAPLITISENTLIYEALLLMEEKGVQHLAVEDENGRIVSVVRNKELIQFQRYAPSVLSREIARAANAEEVAQSCKRTPAVVKVLLDSGAHPRSITHMISTITDAATERLIDLAINELGQPPTPFAFIAMGSQGRMEQTLLTDQDHAIIFATPTEGVTQPLTDYFLTLGNKVSQGLVQAGYPLCHGQVMASNPRWCRPLADWKTYFREWICQAEPQELLDFCISFDFRPVYGAVELAQELRGFIQAELTDQAEFFNHLAKNALDFSPPRRLFGRFYLGIGSPEHAGLNIKDCLMPIVSFARLYALHHGINQTHTLERLDALVEKNVILPASRDEITASYDFLMRLRLQRQTDALQSGHAPDNTIQPAKLGYIEEALLKQAFAQIGAVQKKISFDFLGGTSL
jgi:CBS domain-containing protein